MALGRHRFKATGEGFDGEGPGAGSAGGEANQGQFWIYKYLARNPEQFRKDTVNNLVLFAHNLVQ